MRPSRLKRLYCPELFQGQNTLGNPGAYFEGWYFRLSSRDLNLAVIPGVSLASADPHAFIQVIRGSAGASSYTRYHLHEFRANHAPFRIQVGDNRFSLEGMTLRLPELRADLRFSQAARWPSSLFSPSSMGPYAFLRFLECYHGIILLSARAEGGAGGGEIAGGRIYVEKDWGVSFPRAWVWMQSSCFTPPAVLTCSIARVPLRRRTFTGFILGLLIGQTLYRFTTYNGAVLTRLRVSSSDVEIAVRRGKQTLKLRSSRMPGAPLAAPLEGAMQGRIEETLAAEIEVELAENGQTRFHETGRHAGLEVIRPDELTTAGFDGTG
jgi:tocopherol cyclase